MDSFIIEATVFLRAAALLLLVCAVASAADRLYLKDGTYQLTNEYEVKADRVRYHSTERDEWEEIPLEMVDLDRTKAELTERRTQLAEDAKAEAEERAAEKQAVKLVASIPTQPGAYYLRGEKTETIKQAESKVVNNKKRSVLKVLAAGAGARKIDSGAGWRARASARDGSASRILFPAFRV